MKKEERRVHSAKIEEAMDRILAENNGGEVAVHISLTRGVGQVSEHVRLKDGRMIPYSLELEKEYDKVARWVETGEGDVPAIPQSQSDRLGISTPSFDPGGVTDYLARIGDGEEGVRL